LDSFYIVLTQYTANATCQLLRLALLVRLEIAILRNRQESIVMLLLSFGVLYRAEGFIGICNLSPFS
jgi:hypothetical protein